MIYLAGVKVSWPASASNPGEFLLQCHKGKSYPPPHHHRSFQHHHHHHRDQRCLSNLSSRVSTAFAQDEAPSGVWPSPRAGLTLMSPGHNGNGDGDGVDVGDYDGAPFYAEIYMEFCNTWVMKMVTINERGGAGGAVKRGFCMTEK